MVKKGAWMEEEDTVLVEYVKKHGEGKWHMVERRTALMRGGKSCRLRWFNHLRPNLKRGAFSPEEERIVIELHAQMGNRWARMAKKLPGRSDNEIKNFWNARIKRLERSKLPVYPEDIVLQYNKTNHRNQNCTPTVSNERSLPSLVPSYPNPQNSEFNLSPQLSMGPFNYTRPINHNPVLPNSSVSHHNYNPRNGYFRLGSNSNLPPFSSTSSSSTMHYPNSQFHFSSAYPFQSQFNNFNPNPIPPLSMPNSSGYPFQSQSNNFNPNPIPPLSMPNSSDYPFQSQSNNFNPNPIPPLSMPNSSGYPFQSQSNNDNPNPIPPLTMPNSSAYSFQSQSNNFNPNPIPPLSMLNSSDPQQFLANSEGELSSIQSVLGSPPAACESSNGANLINMSELYNQYCFTPLYTNDGSLEDILRAPKTLVPNNVSSHKGKEICMWDSDCSSSSTNMTTGMLSDPIKEMILGMLNDPIEEMLPSDDDLFPMEDPCTDWYQTLSETVQTKNNQS